MTGDILETLILVDDNDNQIGTASREECHKGKGRRHRAFSVFLFDGKGRMLLQFRKSSKLGGSRWDSAAISHVRMGETYESAAERSMKHEIGISTPVKKIGAFTYTEPYDGYSENEYCAVLVGKYDGEVEPNKDEIDEIRYATLEEIKQELAVKPETYTKWFKESIPFLEKFIVESNFLV